MQLIEKVIEYIIKINKMPAGVMLCLGSFVVIILMHINADRGTIWQWPMFVVASAFLLVGVGLIAWDVFSPPKPPHGFQSLADHTWRGFFARAYKEFASNSGTLDIDLVAHSLWAHFMPKGWSTGQDIDDFIPSIKRLEFEGHFWSGMRMLLPYGNVHLRVMIVKPGGHQARLVDRQQHQAKEIGLDQGRHASEDGIRTLFVIRTLSPQYPLLTVTARVLKEGDLTMTYSICRVGNAVLVGHYPFHLLSKDAPCSEFDRMKDHVGRRFWDQIDDFFTDGRQHRHSVALSLDNSPQSYEEFKDWVLRELRGGGPAPSRPA